jgi:hypothetical protein
MNDAMTDALTADAAISTVAVAITETTELSCVDPTQVPVAEQKAAKPQPRNYSKMKTLELNGYITTRVTQCSELINKTRSRMSELFLALLEMEKRFDKQQGARNDIADLKVTGWLDYLKSIGLPPSTFRTWKMNLRNAADKKMQSLIDPQGVQAVLKSKAPIYTDIDGCAAEILSGGKRLAQAFLNELRSPDEKAHLAKGYLAAIADRDFAHLLPAEVENFSTPAGRCTAIKPGDFVTLDMTHRGVTYAPWDTSRNPSVAGCERSEYCRVRFKVHSIPTSSEDFECIDLTGDAPKYFAAIRLEMVAKVELATDVPSLDPGTV